MNKSDTREESLQKEYYARTANRYDDLHLDSEGKDEHYLALRLLSSTLDHYGIESILDVGSGSGRAILDLKQVHGELRIVGIEPVQELRELGYEKGLSEKDLVDGNVLEMPFNDGEFDLVCAFGVLHHIKDHQAAVAEMLRVANKAIFISDANNFGQGPFVSRFLKQVLNALGLWKLADLVKTGGKGYTMTEEDGLAYSYSVFNDYRQIEDACQIIHLFNTRGGRINFYRTASHVALLGIKR